MTRRAGQLARPGSRVVATGSFLPPVVRHNVELEKLVDTNDVWIRERTGIRERRIAPEGMVTSDMAAEAAKLALERAELTARDIDLVIVATVTPDMPMPATAVFVQQKSARRVRHSICPRRARVSFTDFRSPISSCDRKLRNTCSSSASSFSARRQLG